MTRCERVVFQLQLERARLKAEVRDAIARGDEERATSASRVRDELGRECIALLGVAL